MQQAMSQMMSNPIMQNMMSNPEMLRTMMSSNPAIRQVYCTNVRNDNQYAMQHIEASTMPMHCCPRKLRSAWLNCCMPARIVKSCAQSIALAQSMHALHALGTCPCQMGLTSLCVRAAAHGPQSRVCSSPQQPSAAPGSFPGGFQSCECGCFCPAP